LGRFDRVYAHLPVWAQHVAVSAYGLYWHRLRFGPGYQEYLYEYRIREKFSPAEWRAWTRAKLKDLLFAAAINIPYYRQSWGRTELLAANAGRLEELPLLEKEPLRAAPRAFLREDLHPQELLFHTSGSSGTPIATIWTASELRNAQALREIRSANWAGVSFNLPRATFSGRMIEPDPNSKGPFYRFNRVENQVYFSAFHLSPDTAAQYVEALHRHQIQWLTGYAVSFYLLAKFILERGLEPPPLKAVITTSEKVMPAMRKVMEAAYGCRVYEEYSAVENVLFANECEQGRLHVSPDVGIVEILRPDGTACAPGELGEVVATSLLRTYQALIRYRLGDMAMWSEERCLCGRPMPIIEEVVGRIEDLVIGPDGRQMVRFHGIFVDQPHVREGQIIQEALDRIRAKVVPTAGFGEADVQNIVARIQQRLGPEVAVIVEPVRDIPRTPAGKFQAVISYL
jgi:phenylacetate-CoA ligase